MVHGLETLRRLNSEADEKAQESPGLVSKLHWIEGPPVAKKGEWLIQSGVEADFFAVVHHLYDDVWTPGSALVYEYEIIRHARIAEPV